MKQLSTCLRTILLVLDFLVVALEITCHLSFQWLVLKLLHLSLGSALLMNLLLAILLLALTKFYYLVLLVCVKNITRNIKRN